MTRKRDLKQRVRERQAETGESYVTALRHVQALRGVRLHRTVCALIVRASTPPRPSRSGSACVCTAAAKAAQARGC